MNQAVNETTMEWMIENFGIPPGAWHQLDNGTWVHAGMFVHFGPSANCTLDLCPVQWTVYKYRPLLSVNGLFIGIFFLLLLGHLYVGGVRWKKWGFATFMAVGCAFEILGYIGRILINRDPWSFAAFLIQIIFITSAPVFFTAAIYITLSKAIEFFSPEISRLPPKVFYWLFISADIICLVLQSVGGALSSVSSGSSETGIDVAMSGLILQVIVLVLFSAFLVDYMIRYVRYARRNNTGARARDAIGARQKGFLAGISAAVIFILARCAYRVEELSEGYRDSERITKENLFIGLEGVLIVVAVICLFIGHPGFAFKDGQTAQDTADRKGISGPGSTEDGLAVVEPKHDRSGVAAV